MLDIKRLKDAVLWSSDNAPDHVPNVYGRIDRYENTFPSALLKLIEDALQSVPECWEWSAQIDHYGLRSVTLSVDVSGDRGEMIANALIGEYPFMNIRHWYGGGCTLEIHLIDLYESLKDEQDEYDRSIEIPDFYEIWDTEIDYYENVLPIFLEYGGGLMYPSGPVAAMWECIWTVATQHDLAHDLFAVMHEADVTLEVDYETTIHTYHKDALIMRDELLDVLFREAQYSEKEAKEFKRDLVACLND